VHVKGNPRGGIAALRWRERFQVFQSLLNLPTKNHQLHADESETPQCGSVLLARNALDARLDIGAGGINVA